MQQPPQWGQEPQQPWQQPGQYPQQPMQPPQPPRKSRRGLWIILAIVAFVLIFGCIGVVALASQGAATNTNTGSVATSGNTSVATSAPAATQKPTTAPKWTTTHTFTGNGSKKSSTFAVPDDWKLLWSCDPKSFQGYDYNVIIFVYNSDGSIADTGVNTTCTKTNTHGESEIHTAGNVYLDITSEGSWVIMVQEMR